MVVTLFLAADAQGSELKESWYMDRGKANMEIKNYKAAIEAFEKLIELNPDNREAMRLLGLAYELQGLTDKAIMHYDRYLNRFPDDAEIAFKQARYLEGSRYAYRKKDVIKYYRMGLKVQDNHENRHRLAKLLAANKNTLDEAVKEYRILLKKDPRNPAIREEYRKLLLWDNRYLSEAIQEYENAVKAQPEKFEINHQLARLYYKDDRFTQKAIEQYQKLITKRPRNESLRREYAKSLAKSDRHIDQAVKEYKILLKKDPRNPAIRAEYRKLLLRDDRYLSEAIQEYEKAVKVQPEKFEVNHQLAKLYYKDDRLTQKAIEQYQKLITKRPRNVNLRREYAKALAKSDRHFEEANKQFLMVLKQKDDFETNLAYADHLAKRETTHDEALARYEQLVRKYPDNIEARLKYAGLLSARFERIDLAIEQYQAVLEMDSKNSSAHRELARAYAWKGDNDQAVYHSKRALKYNSQDTIASSLKANLMKGREPKILAGLTYLNQSGDDGYDYSGYILKAGAKADLTPFLTARLDIGRESFEDDLPDIDGTFLNLVVQYRLDPTRRFDVSWTYHDFDDSEDDTENEFNIRYSFQKGDFRISPGVKREIKYDSMLSIAGAKDEVTQKNIGSARSNSIYCKFLYQIERFQASALPYAGYVSAESTDDNFFAGTDADARYYFIEDEAFSFSTQYKFQIYHYEDDNSGFEFSSNEPFAGGYFSPQLFLNNVLLLGFGYQFDNEAVLQLEAGPSFQYANESSDDASWNVGGEAHLSYHMPLAKSLYFNTEGNYFQTSDVYRNYTITAGISYKF